MNFFETWFKGWYEAWRPSKYQLDEYVIKDGKKHPFAIICPGGAYMMIANHVEGKPFAQKLNSMGYSAFVLWYRVRKGAAYPGPTDDLARAVKDIMSRADELDLDTDNYSIWGSSAGGHLAGCFGSEELGWKKYGLKKPNALVLVYPVITMGKDTNRRSKNNLIGKNASQEMIDLTGIHNRVTESFPPSFVWCGDIDKVVPPVNSKLFAEACEAHGVPHRLEIYHNVGHGVGIGKGKPCEGWFEKAVEFWEENK